MRLMTFSLIHSPFLGPSSWRSVGEVLDRNGMRAVTLDLSDALEAGGRFYESFGEIAARQITAPSILVAHSGAGALVPAIERHARGLVHGVIFVDALLPHPGRSWFDTAPTALAERIRRDARRGRASPWPSWLPKSVLAELLPDRRMREDLINDAPEVSLAFLEELAPDGSAAAALSSRAYLQLSEGYAVEAEQARALGWAVERVDGHHLSALTDPAVVAGGIINLALGLARALPSA